MSIPQGTSAREQAARVKGAGWRDAGWGQLARGNNSHVDVGYEVTSMLFVAKAVLR